MSPQRFRSTKTSSGRRRSLIQLTDFVTANLLVVERIDEPIFRVNKLDGSFDATVIHGEDDAAADNVDEINI